MHKMKIVFQICLVAQVGHSFLLNSRQYVQTDGSPNSINLRVREEGSSLLATSKDYSGSSKQINFLLTKAVDLINKLTTNKSKSSNNENAAAEVVSGSIKQAMLPVSLSFSSLHKHLISLKDPAAALEYLALPVEEYSVLDSNLVSRSLLSPDSFILSLPLGDLSSASMMGSGGVAGIKLAATLTTEVTVRPDPAKGRVIMESGPIYFTPTVSTKKTSSGLLPTPTQSASRDSYASDELETNVADSSADVDVNDKQTSDFSDALPEWLLWGGRSVSSSSSKLKDITILDHDGKFPEKEDQKNPVEGIKSSVQARFRIELQWDSPDVSNYSERGGVYGILSRANGMRKSLFPTRDVTTFTAPDASFEGDKSVSTESFQDQITPTSTTSQAMQNPEFDMGSGVEGLGSDISPTSNMSGNTDDAQILTGPIDEEEIATFLPVTAIVKVWLDVNLPVQKDLASAISFPPVKLLLNQAGALTTKAVLRTLAPVLGKLLVSDHESRKRKSGQSPVSEDKQSDTATAYKQTKNIYDDLTSDIDIR